MEIKYEAMFGDQSLFDDAEPDVVLAETNGVYRTFHKESDKPYDVASVSRSDLAMRRIIRTPTWTVADHKAGKLPEVGVKFLYKDETLTCHFIDGDGEIWAHDIDNKIVTPLLRDCKPIETPREKYDRERDECIYKLLAKMPPSSITVVPAMKIVYEELRPFTGGDHD